MAIVSKVVETLDDAVEASTVASPESTSEDTLEGLLEDGSEVETLEKTTLVDESVETALQHELVETLDNQEVEDDPEAENPEAENHQAENPEAENHQAERPLSFLSVRKCQSNFAKFTRGVKLNKGLHFGCRVCEVGDDITALCGVEPDGNCMCHRIRMIKPDTVNIINDAGLVYIPDDIHDSFRDGTEWADLAGVCFRLEVHKCTTCHSVLAHRYVNVDIEKHLVMTWSGELRKVELQGAPEPYFITQSENLTILKETEGADE